MYWPVSEILYAENGFCDSDIDTLGGTSITWPETPAGMTVSLSCPTTNGSATRQCNDQRVWLQPDTSACNAAIEAINNLLEIVRRSIVVNLP